MAAHRRPHPAKQQKTSRKPAADPQRPRPRFPERLSRGAPPRRPIRSRAPSTKTARGPLDLGHILRTRRAKIEGQFDRGTAPTTITTATRKTSGLIRDLGVKQLTGFSIAWGPRVFPDGTGPRPNPKRPRFLQPPDRLNSWPTVIEALCHAVPLGFAAGRCRTVSAAGNPVTPQRLVSRIMPGPCRRAPDRPRQETSSR